LAKRTRLRSLSSSRYDNYACRFLVKPSLRQITKLGPHLVQAEGGYRINRHRRHQKHPSWPLSLAGFLDGWRQLALWRRDRYHRGCSQVSLPSLFVVSLFSALTFSPVHSSNQNQMTLHTSPGCTLSTPMQASGTILTTEFVPSILSISGELELIFSLVARCNAFENWNIGCGVQDPSPTSYGKGWNDNGGGVSVTHWDETGISMWSFLVSSAFPLLGLLLVFSY